MIDKPDRPDGDGPIDFYIQDWARIIYDAFLDQEKVDRVLELARLNGMFDPIKVARLTATRDGAEGAGKYKCSYCADHGVVGRRYPPDWKLSDEPCPECSAPQKPAPDAVRFNILSPSVIAQAYRDWAWMKKGEAVGNMLAHEAARCAFAAGAGWAHNAAPVPPADRAAPDAMREALQAATHELDWCVGQLMQNGYTFTTGGKVGKALSDAKAALSAPVPPADGELLLVERRELESLRTWKAEVVDRALGLSPSSAGAA